MSDALDAVAKAMERMRKLAANELVRKADLEAELSRLAAEREGASETLAAAIDERLAEATAELAASETRHREAMNELEELRKLADQARGPEETALGSARTHLRDLETRSRVAEEIAKAPEDVIEEHGKPSKKTF